MYRLMFKVELREHVMYLGVDFAAAVVVVVCCFLIFFKFSSNLHKFMTTDFFFPPQFFLCFLLRLQTRERESDLDQMQETISIQFRN